MQWIKKGDPGYAQILAQLKGEKYHGPTSQADEEAIKKLVPQRCDAGSQKK